MPCGARRGGNTKLSWSPPSRGKLHDSFFQGDAHLEFKVSVPLKKKRPGFPGRLRSTRVSRNLLRGLLRLGRDRRNRFLQLRRAFRGLAFGAKLLTLIAGRLGLAQLLGGSRGSSLVILRLQRRTISRRLGGRRLLREGSRGESERGARDHNVTNLHYKSPSPMNGLAAMRHR